MSLLSIFKIRSESKVIPQRGFTLVEALVAVALISVAIVAPLTIASRGIAISNFSRDQTIATYLVEDAVEYVLDKKRQNQLNIINGVLTTGSGAPNWLDGFTLCVGYTGGPSPAAFDVDSINDSTDLSNQNRFISGGVCSATSLQYHTADGRFGHGAAGALWKNTKFTRSILIDEISLNHEARLTVTVSWQSPLGTKSFSIVTNMYNTQL